MATLEPMSDSGCPFCRVQSAAVLASNRHAIAFFDRFPVAEGHILIVPLLHVTSLFDLSQEDRAGTWQLVDDVRRLLLERFEPQGFNVGLNDGAAAGQTVFHAHIHVIPRYTGDVADSRGGVRWVLPANAAYWQGRS